MSQLGSVSRNPVGGIKHRRLTLPLYVLSLVLCGCVCAAAQRPALVVQTGHSNEVRTVGFSPDGKLLASGSADNTIKIWDVATGTELRTLLGHQKEVLSLSFSPDGKILASGSIDRTIRLWEIVSGHEVRMTTLPESTGFVSSVAFSPDGKTLASGSYDARVSLWDVATGMELRRLTGHSSEVNSVAYSPDGKLLASASADRTIKLWEVSSGQLIHSLLGHSGEILSIAMSPDGRTLASAGADQTVKLWDVLTGGELHTLTGHTDIVKAVSFSRNGKFLASGSRDESIKLWDVATGQGVRLFQGHSSVLTCLALSPDSRVIASGNRDASIKLWDVGAGTESRTLKAHMQEVDSVAFSPGGRTLASVTGNNVIKLWDVATGRELRNLSGTSMKRHSVNVVFSLGGKVLAGLSDDQTIKLWDVATGNELRTFKGGVKDISSIAISPDGRVLASGGDDFAVRLWDVTTGKLLRIFAGHENTVTSVAFAASGRLLASGSADGTVRLWDVALGQLVGMPQKHDTSILSVAFSPDGKILARAGGDGVIRLFDVATKRELRALKGHSRAVLAVAFSPDGRLLASGSYDKTIKLWDVSTGRQVHDLTGHSSIVVSVAFSPDGKILASGSRDATTKLWDVTSGVERASLISVDEDDWLVVTPDGLFDGSTAAWKQIYWRYSQNLLDTAPVEVFFNEFFQPGLLADIFEGRRLRSAQVLSARDRRQPQVKLSLAELPPQASARLVKIWLEVAEAPPNANNSSGSGAQGVRLFRNGSLVKIWRGDVLRGRESITLEASVPIGAGENLFSAYAFNRDNVKSSDAHLIVQGPEALRRAGTFRVLSVGINRYADPGFDLSYAVADSEAFSSELKRQQERLGSYRSVEVMTLFNQDATKANILSALERLATSTQPEDAVVVYFAGHGMAQQERFFFIPHDLGHVGSRSKVGVADSRSLSERAISDRELEAAFERIDAAHILLVLDTSNSGQALETEDSDLLGPLNSKGLAQLAYEKGMYILAATQGNQVAVESGQLRHGLLNYALIEEGLKDGAADYAPRDGLIHLREWLDFVVGRVPHLQAEMSTGIIERAARRRNGPGGRAGQREGHEVQRPRVFYPRELNARPLVIARP